MRNAKRLPILGAMMVCCGTTLSCAENDMIPTQIHENKNKEVVSGNNVLTLFDGRKITLEAVRYNKNSTLLTQDNRTTIERELMQFPADNALVLMLRQPNRTHDSAVPYWRIDLRDDASGYCQTYSTKGADVPTHPEYVFLRVDNFPRRGKTLTATFRDVHRVAEIYGTVQFPNPGQQTRPQWTPDTLPASRTQEDLTFVLKKAEYVVLRDGLGMPYDLYKPPPLPEGRIRDPKRPYPPPEAKISTVQEIAERGTTPEESLYRYLTFQLKERGAASRDWGVWEVIEEDAYGRKSYRRVGMVTSSDPPRWGFANDHVAGYNFGLPSNENFRLKVVAQKRINSPAEPDEVWRFEDIVLPTTQKPVPLSHDKNPRQGITLESGKVTPLKTSQPNTVQYWVTTYVSGLSLHSRLVLQAVDAEGKLLAVHDDVPYELIHSEPLAEPPSKNARRTFILRLNKPARKCTLILRALPNKTFDFTLPGTYKPPK